MTNDSRSSRAPVEGIHPDAAVAYLEGAVPDEELFALARSCRDAALPEREAAFCGILQARLGGCPEDCAFCCQSAHHDAALPSRPLASVEEMVARAEEIAAMGARAFSVVCSGRGLDEGELDGICRALERVRTELGLETCASLGRLRRRELQRLVSAGLVRYHHNLEAAPSFFSRVVSTYRLEESLETLAEARAEGLELCSSGVFGMGETAAQRAELVETLRGLAVESVPINFLEPRPGTPLGDRPLLEPEEALRIIAVHRLMLPAADVIVAGGRDLVLGPAGARVYEAGANGVMVGDYVTCLGGEVERDHAAARSAGLSLRAPRFA